MIELTINGKKIGTGKGSTILQAALSNGIKIPNLCYDKRIEPYGGCRLCVVEIEGQKKLEASCATLAAEGMIVQTETPRVRKIRQNVLEFMMVHHPLDCPVCDKAGECELQDLVFQYGRPEGRFAKKKKNVPPDARSTFVELNSNRCILCGKCVRLCSEHQGQGALGFMGRGFPTIVRPAFGEILNCDYCGQCIDVCPTGAILSKPFKFKARQWSLEEKDTICPFCGCGCTLTLGIADGKILKSMAREDRGVNQGDLCGRGRFGIDYIYSENRLKSPMIRKDGELVPVSWDEALNTISYRLKNLINAYGPSSIGAIGSPRCTNEENYILRKFMRTAIGSDNIDSVASFGYGLADKAWKKAFGLGNHRIDLRSPFGKDLILVIESDPSITHPLFGINILKAKRQGSRLIVADSRETKLTRHSTHWARIKQGTGVALLNGVMKISIDRGLINDQEASTIKGYPEFKEALREYTPEKVFEITGVGREELISIAEALVYAKTRMLTLSIGVSENSKTADTVLAATNLINLLGESPDSLQIPAEYANTFGSYRMGIGPDAGIPHQTAGFTGMDIFEMLYEPYSLKALYIIGADPLGTFPDNSKIITTLKSLKLLIVQDIFLTETAKIADVVLPAASWAEKDGTFTNAEGNLQKVYRLVDPAGESVPDWLILKKLALTMGQDLGVRNLQDIQEEIKTLLTKKTKSETKRIFNPVEFKTGDITDETYPFRLVLRDVLQHSGSTSTSSRSLDLVISEALLEINEEDAKKRGILDNSHVKLASKQGSVFLKAKYSDAVPEGTLFVPAHFAHAKIHALTHLAVNGECPIVAVNIEATK